MNKDNKQIDYLPISKRIPITRCGSSPKLICYTQSNSARDFNYQKPHHKTNLELRGRSIRHIQPTPSKDIIQFRIISINKTPNTKRTLIPELAVSNIPLLL